MFKNLYKLFDEETGGEGLAGGAPAPAEGAPAEGTPEYLFGDVTADEAAERFGFLRSLPNDLRGLETRVSETVNPVMERLTGIQESLGTQPVFDPKLDKFKAALEAYDPKLAESVLPALVEDLKASMALSPLGPEALEPHLNPMLQSRQEALVSELVPALLNNLPFDANQILNRDPQNPDNVLPAKTDLQKDFVKWWDQMDVPTREALGSVGLPYVQALQRFSKWRADELKRKGEAAGAASARLSTAAQAPNGGKRETNSGLLQTEEDGFKSVFAKRS